MNFWAENTNLDKPSVCLSQIDGNMFVASKEGVSLPTVCHFPKNPADLMEVLGLAIDAYTLAVNECLASDNVQLVDVRARLSELANSIESAPITL